MLCFSLLHLVAHVFNVPFILCFVITYIDCELKSNGIVMLLNFPMNFMLLPTKFICHYFLHKYSLNADLYCNASWWSKLFTPWQLQNYKIVEIAKKYLFIALTIEMIIWRFHSFIEFQSTCKHYFSDFLRCNTVFHFSLIIVRKSTKSLLDSISTVSANLLWG